MSVDDEREWWDSLEGPEIVNNTVGWPPYDLEAVAGFLELVLDRSASPVLDLGCGFGRLTNRMAKCNPFLTFEGMDISPRLIDLADQWAASNARYGVCDGRTLAWGQPGGFAAAYSVTVFQHLPDDAVRGYVSQVHEALRDGGRFAFTWVAGAENTFLSHQTSHDVVDDWLGLAGFASWLHLTCSDHPSGWRWVVATKGSS
jgi:SAM-dependent methyltransferase